MGGRERGERGGGRRVTCLIYNKRGKRVLRLSIKRYVQVNRS